MSSWRNNNISFLKWIAIIAVTLIHLINWSDIEMLVYWKFFKNLEIVISLKFLKNFLHIGTLFFVTLSGSLIIIAYAKYDNLKKPTIKLIKRAFYLLFIYYIYNIVKWLAYNFQREPFFLQFIEKGKWQLVDLLTFQSFSVPITILVLWTEFLLITPIILYINKYCKYRKTVVLLLISFFTIINYFFTIPRNGVTEILYWENTSLFSFNLWILPYLIWLFVWMIWFDKKKKEILAFFSSIFITLAILNYYNWITLETVNYMYPLKPYYIVASFFAMFLLIYVLDFLQKLRFIIFDYCLSILKYIWDNTMFFYISHWIIIDLTRLFLDARYIWHWVIIFNLLYIAWRIPEINKVKLELYK